MKMPSEVHEGPSGGAHRCLSHLLEAQAARSPAAVALAAPGRAPLTFARLHAHLADTLDTLGVGPHNRVALQLPEGPELGVAVLAVAAGATCAPLNPALRAAECEAVVADLDATAVVVLAGSESPVRPVARARGIRVIELTPSAEAAGLFTLSGDGRTVSARGRAAQPDDVALLLPTSGTTARPKLVPLTHANLLASAQNIRMALALGKDDRGLNVMPFFHIHGLMMFLTSLAAGGSVLCPPGFDVTRFFAWWHDWRPTWYSAVPTMHQAILQEAARHAEIIARSPLRFVRSSSAPLPPAVAAELEQVFGVPVIEAYGMTEAAHQIATNPLPPGRRKPGSVGRPAGTEVAILDPAGNHLPADATGEIAIRGPNVTQGHANQPAANAAAFTEAWLRTGDEGFLDGEGYLFLTGRLKELINRGGAKIAPREVDDALLAHPAVAQAATFAVSHPTLGEDVAAVVVLRGGAVAAAEEIRSFTAQHLADFKVPRQILIVSDIPKGPTGKQQRLRLAEQFGLGAPGDGQVFVGPRTPTETALAAIWAQVLQVQRVGLHDNFFALGGDSIRASMVIARVRDGLKVALPLRSLFEAPTISALATLFVRYQRPQMAEADVARLLAKVEDLSEREAERLLAGETPHGEHHADG